MQHPDARLAFVTRQECASLGVLAVRFECPADYAHGQSISDGDRISVQIVRDDRL